MTNPLNRSGRRSEIRLHELREPNAHPVRVRGQNKFRNVGMVSLITSIAIGQGSQYRRPANKGV